METYIPKEIIGNEITGKEFNEQFVNISFVKLTNSSEYHNGIQLKEGLNTYLPGDVNMTHLDTPEYEWKKIYLSKAIDFVKESDAWMWLHHDDETMFHMRKVIIPDDAVVCVKLEILNCMKSHVIKSYGMIGRIITNKIILGEKEYISTSTYMQAVMNNGLALQFIPYSLQTKRICLEAVKQHGAALEYVSENLKDIDICMEAVIQNGKSLKYVPDNLINEPICEYAVKQHGFAVYYVPNVLKTEAICLTAVKNDYQAMLCVPENIKTKNICEAAVKQHGSMLYYVPKHLINRDICMMAVKQDGMALYYVPDELKDYEMCETSIDQRYDAIKYVPLSKRTQMLLTNGKFIGLCMITAIAGYVYFKNK